ncbi:hypothetical protein CEXT_234821 [Caerostris extrusa]|uniref:Uncharacterized protein n=1 Tax=Caerostris extrusa TaxID=172846 RepID=A0AAV4QR52_CAEEX|nr:hypothetical protein CEXT_234821 [Caerostris extrusa]
MLRLLPQLDFYQDCQTNVNINFLRWRLLLFPGIFCPAANWEQEYPFAYKLPERCAFTNSTGKHNPVQGRAEVPNKLIPRIQI